MLTRLPLLLIAFLGVGLSAGEARASSNPCFVPGQNCEQRILDEINHATTSLQIQAYVFTDPQIEAAILAAQQRHVAVQIIIDRNWRSHSATAVAFFLRNQIPIVIDRMHAIAHNKIIIIDLARVLTGSYNFSISAATSNAENSVLITDEPATIAAYELNFRRHLAHSLPP